MASESDKIGESLMLFRAHHALADGASMAAAFLDLGDEAPQIRALIQQEVDKRFGKATSTWWKKVYQQFLFALWMVTGSLSSAWYHFKLSCANLWWTVWGSNPWAVLEREYTLQQKAEGKEEIPDRSVSFATLCTVEQAKWVAQTLAGRRATLNDVMCTAVSRALAKQLQWHRQQREATHDCDSSKTKTLPQLKHFHMAVPVHLKGGIIMPNESVSNSIGAFCVSLPCENDQSGTERLKKVHKELSIVKRRPTAFLSHYAARISSQVLPASWVSYLFSRAGAGSSCVVTNVRGYDRAIHLQGSKIEAMYGFVPLAPGIPIGVVVGSYNGQVQLTLTAQPWAVPDADRFLSWVMEDYVDLVHAAAAKDSD
uniref:O-acyltransferase WSD1 C-terminal domain-containing protein n=1 Tax=Entomoneis paludosa TaxID=265537 RepID=A0A7S2Y6A0_9STRA